MPRPLGAQPAKVYLDQSDWSDLQHGHKNAEAAEPALRELGARGRAVFLVSFEHFIESGALRGGLEARLEFTRSFPGTLWMNASGRDILKRSVQAAVAIANGAAFEAMSIEARPMLQYPTSEIARTVRPCGVLRALLSGVAMAEHLPQRRLRHGAHRPRRPPRRHARHRRRELSPP